MKQNKNGEEGRYDQWWCFIEFKEGCTNGAAACIAQGAHWDVGWRRESQGGVGKQEKAPWSGMERIEKWAGMVQKEKWAWGIVVEGRGRCREAIAREEGTRKEVGWENHCGGGIMDWFSENHVVIMHFKHLAYLFCIIRSLYWFYDDWCPLCWRNWLRGARIHCHGEMMLLRLFGIQMKVPKWKAGQRLNSKSSEHKDYWICINIMKEIV